VTDPDVEILLPDAGAQILDVAMPTEPGRWTPPARAAAFDQPATSTDATNLDLEVGPISGHSKPGTKAPTPGNPATFTISGSSSDDTAGTETYTVTTAARRVGNLTEISGTVTCLRTTENDPCSTMHDFSEEISTDTADGIDLVNYRTHTTYFPADGSSQAAGGTLGQGTGAGFGFDLAPGATESFFNWYVTDAPGELAAEFPNGGPTLKQ
jgi:hypothetical protein